LKDVTTQRRKDAEAQRDFDHGWHGFKSFLSVLSASSVVKFFRHRHSAPWRLRVSALKSLSNQDGTLESQYAAPDGASVRIPRDLYKDAAPLGLESALAVCAGLCLS
jgi:hypothetical protein